ncbi:hypothetical protein ACVMB1_005033 [Bradyrhizobium sp. USDA 4504]
MAEPSVNRRVAITGFSMLRRGRRYAETVMAETQIEWTDATWNPVAGCSIVSAGCTNCYAMEMARRLHAMSVPKYKGLTRRSGKRTIWNGVVREDASALEIPLRWRKPRKIFVNSMSDLFHDRVSDDFILKVWDVMRRHAASPLPDPHETARADGRTDRIKNRQGATERLARHQRRECRCGRSYRPPAICASGDPIHIFRTPDRIRRRRKPQGYRLGYRRR